MTRKYLYYPGCSVEASANAYDISTRAVAPVLGVEMEELDDWNCCGATSYMSIRELRSFAISGRNLALAEAAGCTDLITVCNACYTVLSKANEYITDNRDLRDKINDALAAAGLHYSGSVKVRHFLDVVVNDVGLDKVKSKIRKPLSGVRVACYYGCQLTRPHGRFDDVEFPTVMDDLFKTCGADVVDYPMKTKCCAGMLMTTDTSIAESCCKSLLQCAVDSGAECIVTACPLCQINLDAYQDKINRRFGTSFKIPVVYFTQLLGLAFGIKPKTLGFGKEITSARSVVAKVA